MAKKGFIASLFDFSFSSFVTAKLIRLLYIFSLLFHGGYALAIGFGVTGLIITLAGTDAPGAAIGATALLYVMSPIYFVFGVLISRIFCELMMLAFRVAESLVQIEANTRRE